MCHLTLLASVLLSLSKNCTRKVLLLRNIYARLFACSLAHWFVYLTFRSSLWVCLSLFSSFIFWVYMASAVVSTWFDYQLLFEFATSRNGFAFSDFFFVRISGQWHFALDVFCRHVYKYAYQENDQSIDCADLGVEQSSEIKRKKNSDRPFKIRISQLLCLMNSKPNAVNSKRNY